MANTHRKTSKSARSTIKFKSGFEETIYDVAVRNRKKLEYEALRLSYSIACTYTPDFTLPNGIIVEAKGKFTAADRRKMVAVKRSHPHLDIRFVFMRANNPLRKGAKMKYWQWAEKHQFPWSEGTIPLDWWKEKKRGN